MPTPYKPKQYKPKHYSKYKAKPKPKPIQLSISKQFWYHNTDQELTNILVDLEKADKVNVVTLYAKYIDKQKSEIKSNKKLTKKETIILNNMKDIQKSMEKKDLYKFNKYISEIDLEKDGLQHIKYLESDKMKDFLKFEILKNAKNKKNNKLLIELYMQLENSKFKKDKPEYNKIIIKIEKKFNEMAYKYYIIKHLGNKLPPLDFYNRYEKTLDDWQIDIIESINDNKSVIVSAPTSSGKTWCSIYSVVRNTKYINKVTLYIVPSKPLALQVTGMFRKLVGTKVSLIVNDRIFYSSDTRVIVATIEEAETNIYKFYENIDFVIFDEIHNLNNELLGPKLENIIKLFSHCNFLALSATIANIDSLREWWSSFNTNEIKTITYKKRFINLQRWQFNFNTSNLEKLHPLDCIETNKINELLTYNLPFTPYDLSSLWDKLEENFEYDDISEYDPDEFIQSKRPTLDDTKKYEEHLVSGLIKLNETEPDKINKILENYNKKPSHQKDNVDISSFGILLKQKDLLPAIIFNHDSPTCNTMYNDLVKGIVDKEKLYYPFRYSTLELIQDLINDYKINYKKFELSKEKSAKSTNCKNRLDRQNLITTLENMEASFVNTELTTFKTKLITQHNKNTKEIETNADLSDYLKKLQLRNLKKEHTKYMKMNCIPTNIDVFEKHPDFCFTQHNPMTADEIRDIRRELGKALKCKLSYMNIFLQGLKYGVGLYTERMNDVYKHIVQRLCQNNKLYIVISDRELSQGVNFPFRASVMMGYNESREFPTLFAQQAAGRAGRRGQDKEGHLIFINNNWTNIMKGKLSKLTSKKEISTLYPLLNDISNIDYKIIYKKYLSTDSDVSNEEIDDMRETLLNEELDDYHKMVCWKLRYYGDNILTYMNLIESLIIKYKGIVYNNQHEYEFIRVFNNIMKLEPTLLDNYKNHIYSESLFKLGEILKTTINSGIKQVEYSNVFVLLIRIFNNIKTIIMDSQGLTKDY